MSDIYQKIATSPVGKRLLTGLGLPTPTILERQRKASADFVSGRVLLGAAPGAALLDDILHSMAKAPDAWLCCQAHASTAAMITQTVAARDLRLTAVNTGPADSTLFKALVFDATGIQNTTDLKELHRFFSPVARKTTRSGRILVLGRPACECDNVSRAAAMRALEGFTRSLAKETGKKGTTVQLLYVSHTATADQLESPLRFCLSPRSAYISAQVMTVGAGIGDLPALDWHQPLADTTALVTGAAQGIGAAIATIMARDGARVLCLDRPQAAKQLEALAQTLGGIAVTADITAADAPSIICDALEKAHGSLDAVIHNAGITRDRTLAKMSGDWWNQVIDVNLSSAERMDAVLLERQLLKRNGRIVCVSSMSGIAGNFGQTNYATSKAGVIGYVQAMAPALKEKGITINAVAPGFIETKMTAAMPLVPRALGRRMNSLCQGGLPEDVAETIGFFASPASTGLTGNLVRVCGQSLLGA